MKIKKRKVFVPSISLKWLTMYDQAKGTSANYFFPGIISKFSEGIPPTKRMADDVIIAFDLNSGKQIWKTELSGIPSGRSSSSTPCLANNRIFAVGGERLFCVTTKEGISLWETNLEAQAVASSPLFFNGKVYVLANSLQAFDSLTGKKVWENKDIRGKSASAIVWKKRLEDFNCLQLLEDRILCGSGIRRNSLARTRWRCIYPNLFRKFLTCSWQKWKCRTDLLWGQKFWNFRKMASSEINTPDWLESINLQ